MMEWRTSAQGSWRYTNTFKKGYQAGGGINSPGANVKDEGSRASTYIMVIIARKCR